jgi:hypothetical protein
MKISFRSMLRLAILGVAFGTVLIWFFWKAESRERIFRSSEQGQRVFRPEVAVGPSSAPERTMRSSRRPAESVPSRPDPETSAALETAFQQLTALPGESQAAEILRELSRNIRAAGPETASEVAVAIIAFLDTGRDAETGLPLIVGPDGTLGTAPTLRVCLIDLLGSVDPAAALLSAREWMERTDSADEYAICLRNLYWNDHEGDRMAEVKDRMNQMLETKDWFESPSAGWLEGLDVAVALGDEESFVKILRLARMAGALESDEAGAAVQRATMMVVDRMVVRDSGLLTKTLAADLGKSIGLSGIPRASLMSRLDPADEGQVNLLRRYLEIPDHEEGELEYFSNLFPNGNHLHGNWLFSSAERPPSIADREAADRLALERIEGLLEEEGLGPQGREVAARIRERLVRLRDQAPAAPE